VGKRYARMMLGHAVPVEKYYAKMKYPMCVNHANAYSAKLALHIAQFAEGLYAMSTLRSARIVANPSVQIVLSSRGN